MVRNDIFVGADNGLVRGYSLGEPAGRTYAHPSEMGKSVCAMVWSDEDIIWADKSGIVSRVNPSKWVERTKFPTEETNPITGLGDTGSGLIVSDASALRLYGYHGGLRDELRVKACHVMRLIGESGVVFAGRGANVRVVHFPTGEEIFSAKKPPNDWLSLSVPVNITDLSVFGDNIVSADSSGEVCVLDVRDPRGRLTFGVSPGLSAVDVMDDQVHVICGDATGNVFMADLRKPKTLWKYRGGRGSVKAIGHVGLNIVSASLDGCVRLWRVGQRRAPAVEICVDSRLTALLLREDGNYADCNLTKST